MRIYAIFSHLCTIIDNKTMSSKITDLLKRYLVATFGLLLVAVGVALSIKSDLGTSPVSCPPYVLNLWNSKFTVGEYTIMMHLFFILLQVILLRKKFKVRYLMQIVAAVVFGFLTDLSIWAFSWVSVSTYAGRMLLCIISVIITALGISIEVVPQAWMLAGDQTVWTIAEVGKAKFSTVKVIFDVVLVAVSALFAYIVFNNPLGSHDYTVIREGTLIFAIFTGLCMKLTDPLVKKLFPSMANGR